MGKQKSRENKNRILLVNSHRFVNGLVFLCKAYDVIQAVFQA